MPSNLHVPCDASNILRGLALCPRGHGGCELVQIPDVNLRVRSSRRQEIALEGVEVEGLDGAGVLVLGEHDRVGIALDHLVGVVHGDHAAIQTTYDSTLRSETVHNVSIFPCLHN